MAHPSAAAVPQTAPPQKGQSRDEKAMAKRKIWVEPLFGEAKDWHGLRRFRLRRLWKVDAEALLIATGQNLKRLLRKRGWGRRPWPNGAPEAPFACRFLARSPRWSPSLV